MENLHETNPPLRLLATFNDAFDQMPPGLVIKAPGREMWVAASVDGVKDFVIHSSDHDGHTRFDWRSAKNKKTVLKRPLPRWVRYPAGVIVHLCANDMDLPGVRAVIAGEEAGERYDYATGIAFAALWHHLYEKDYTAAQLIPIVEHVRREYVEG
jgi:galactokinase